MTNLQSRCQCKQCLAKHEAEFDQAYNEYLEAVEQQIAEKHDRFRPTPAGETT